MTGAQVPLPRHCHLLEITPMPGVRYSINLGYLHASLAADETCARHYEVTKHVVYQEPGFMKNPTSVLDGISELDVLAISVYFWNRQPSLAVAQAAKARWPDATIIVGGNEVTNQAEQVFAEAPGVDVIVNGEGEVTFCELLRSLVGGAPQSLHGIAGISFRDGNSTVTTEARPRISDLGTIPSPLLSGVYQDADIRDSRIIIFETNRGCPYSCAFCYWGGATSTKVRRFPLERIKAEITYIATHAGPDSTLFIADANFGILPQDMEIAEWLVGELRRLNKRMFLFTNWAKNTTERVLSVAEILFSGNLISAVTLSAQSFTPDVLDIARRANIKPTYYRELQRAFQARAIPTYTELIWGLPGESLDTYLDGIECVIDSGGHPVVYPLLLLNNTEYTTATFRGAHSIRTRRLPYQFTNPEMLAEVVVEHDVMPEADWLLGLELRLSVAVFYSALLGGLLRVTSMQTQTRVVDLCMMLTDYLRGLDPKTSVGALAQNYRATWTDPDAYRPDLVMRFVDAASIPEHMHYQAIIRSALAGTDYEDLVRGADAYLRTQLGPCALPSADNDELVAYQLASCAALALNLRGRASQGDVTVTLSQKIHQQLVDVGHLLPVSTSEQHRIVTGERQVTFSGTRYAQSPPDSLLLAIYHGSIRIGRSLQRLEDAH